MAMTTSTPPRLRHNDHQMVPLFLVRAMFALMLGAIALVGFAQLSGVPNVGAVSNETIVAERLLVMTGDRSGIYTVTSEDGTLLASSSDPLDGFIGVIGRVIDRNRVVAGVAANEPVRLVRRNNGRLAIIDDAAGWSVELIGYGADNVAAFATLLP